ncbi:uncharacterized protein LY89DRAFT_619896 [Mollisia scopiformis]|uniref:Inheritance of peroxisomes protein 1 n=1 Tax=Mollisia scopiformis TaxID=149040 RepID=A0A194X3H1_MOLSC|nr:uncharacterized protein LY89DRAFT_619896 [Mollisia scopiformis]KUJ14745.1 hypothetical protein LY89DRAFT_619896 [Mollisia scopiformis]
MMASMEPTTPSVKRSFSLPPQTSKTASSPDSQIEILYNLPSVRIVQFNAGKGTASVTSSSRPSSSSGSPVIEEQPGTLSWVSRFERTIAVGALRIYRAPGSVAFLNCQSALRPILPKSQAWCVDGDSKFVLQIRPPQYWRIEVPNTSAAEKLGVEELKRVLDQVLRFEKTPCPFQRDFTVELPEEPQTPIKKRPWRPVERPKSEEPPESGRSRANSAAQTPKPTSPVLEPTLSSGDSDHPPTPLKRPDVPRLISEIEVLSQAQDTKSATLDESIADEETQVLPEVEADCRDDDRVTLDTTSNFAEGSLKPSLLESPDAEYRFESYVDSEEENDSFSDATDDTGLTPKESNQPFFQPLTAEPDREKPQALQNCSRSVTAPPVLSLVTSPPSKHRTKSTSPLRYSTNVESNSDFSSSVDSFHSVQSWHSPLAPPSPPASQPSSPATTYPYPHENIVLPKRPLHTRDASEQTVSPETPRIWDVAADNPSDSASRGVSPPPKTPPLVNDGSEKSDEEPAEVVTPPTVRSTIRHRATTSSNSRRRALSPLPPAVNLFSPPRRRPRKLQTARHLPTAIIQKTCEILLSPPSHLFHLMISIATKIAAGEWRGMLSSHGEAVHWDFEDEYGGDPWFEDDYNMGPPRLQNKAKSTSSNTPGGSWEVD